MSRLLTLALLCLVPVSGMVFGQENAPPKTAVVSLPGDISSLDVNPKTGTVFVAFDKDNKVIAYPKLTSAQSVDGARTIKDVRSPKAVAFKQVGEKSYLLILSSMDEKLHVYDAETLESVKVIHLAGASPGGLVCSRNANDSHVYYTYGGGHDCRFAAVNLKTFKDEGVPTQESTATLAISGDGEMGYILGPWSPSGFRSGRLIKEKEKVRYEQVHHEHTSNGFYLCDPGSQFVITGSKVWSLDLKRSLATLPTPAAFISAHRPIMIGLKSKGDRFDERDRKTLAIMSSNTYKIVATHNISLPAVGDKFGFDRFGTLRMAEDPRSDCLILWRGTNVEVIPYAALELPKEPFLTYEVDGARDIITSRNLEWTLTPKEKDITFSVEEGPKGLAIKGNKLTWTPGVTDVGTHKVVIKAASGMISKNRELTLSVRMPSVKLPFSPTQMAVSEDGKFAFVLGGTQNNEDRFGPRGMGISSKQIALVDLEKLQIVAKRDLLTPVRSIAIDSHFAYIALADSELVQALDCKTLTEKRKFFTNGAVQRLAPVNDRLLWVVTNSGSATVLKTPELTAAETTAVGAGIHLSGKGQASSVPARLGLGWYYDGVVYDETLRKPVRLVHPPGLTSGEGDRIRVATGPAADQGMREKGFPFDRGAGREESQVPDGLKPWGVSVRFGQLHAGKRALNKPAEFRPFDNPPEVVEVLPDVPAAVRLRLNQDGKVYLAFLDLVTGRPGDEQKLREGAPVFRRDWEARPIQLKVCGKSVIALVESELYQLPVPKLDPATYAETFHFAATQPADMPGKTLVVSLPKVVGGTAPVELSLVRELPGVTLDGKKQVITVDTKELADHLTANNKFEKRDKFNPFDGGAMDASKLRQAELVYERLTGKKATGVPVWVPLAILARDAELQETRTDIGFYVEVPRSTFAATEKQPERPNRERDLLQRIADLEEAVERLNRQMDLLQGKKRESQHPR